MTLEQYYGEINTFPEKLIRNGLIIATVPNSFPPLQRYYLSAGINIVRTDYIYADDIGRQMPPSTVQAVNGGFTSATYTVNVDDFPRQPSFCANFRIKDVGSFSTSTDNGDKYASFFDGDQSDSSPQCVASMGEIVKGIRNTSIGSNYFTDAIAQSCQIGFKFPTVVATGNQTDSPTDFASSTEHYVFSDIDSKLLVGSLPTILEPVRTVLDQYSLDPHLYNGTKKDRLPSFPSVAGLAHAAMMDLAFLVHHSDDSFGSTLDDTATDKLGWIKPEVAYSQINFGYGQYRDIRLYSQTYYPAGDMPNPKVDSWILATPWDDNEPMVGYGLIHYRLADTEFLVRPPMSYDEYGRRVSDILNLFGKDPNCMQKICRVYLDRTTRDIPTEQVIGQLADLGNQTVETAYFQYHALPFVRDILKLALHPIKRPSFE